MHTMEFYSVMKKNNYVIFRKANGTLEHNFEGNKSNAKIKLICRLSFVKIRRQYPEKNMDSVKLERRPVGRGRQSG